MHQVFHSHSVDMPAQSLRLQAGVRERTQQIKYIN
uniref:Uncharacterized protein n=1 Tax=Anguilla anguilla TaxID=7936 RepID=A0A0E9TML7_ANGAN